MFTSFIGWVLPVLVEFCLYWPSWTILAEFVKISPVYDWYDVNCFCHISTVLDLLLVNELEWQGIWCMDRLTRIHYCVKGTQFRDTAHFWYLLQCIPKMFLISQGGHCSSLIKYTLGGIIKGRLKVSMSTIRKTVSLNNMFIADLGSRPFLYFSLDKF